METLLEQQRRYHEERERQMDAMTKEMLHPTKTVSLRHPEIDLDLVSRFQLNI